MATQHHRTLLPALLLLVLLGECSGHKLLKVPRIYNALITTDEELLPSQAYPAVAPVLRPSPGLYISGETAGYPEVPEPAAPPQQPLPSLPEGAPSPSEWQQVKNNKPGNPDIPDVPPPPIPVAFRPLGKP